MRLYITEEKKRYTSFLECVRQEGYSVKDLNKKAVIHFLSTGLHYFNETFISGMEKQFTHQKYSLDPDQGIQEIGDGEVSPLDVKTVESPVEAFLEFFAKRVKFLAGRKLSLDLTGGIDSRLVATVLHHFGISFDTVFSRDSGTGEEAEIVRTVAGILGRPVQILQSAGPVDKKQLNELFQIGDAHFDVLALRSLRNTQSWRKGAGYDLVITGIGGELYKDFWWQQDFPFYTRQKPDLEKLLGMRMHVSALPDKWLGGHYRFDAKAHLISILERYIQSTNTRTYDQIYYQVKIREQVSVMTRATGAYLDVYSPLLEKDLLDIGYNLPRRRRFFNRFHRQVITALNPHVARIPTTEGGMTVSGNRMDILNDLSLYGKDKTSKLLTKIRRKRNEPAGSDPQEEGSIVAAEIKESLELMKDSGIFSTLAPTVQNELPAALRGRVLTIGMLLKMLR
ncbi:MAG: hypothetical protein WD266_08735 [Balneolales bacterium]